MDTQNFSAEPLPGTLGADVLRMLEPTGTRIVYKHPGRTNACHRSSARSLASGGTGVSVSFKEEKQIVGTVWARNRSRQVLCVCYLQLVQGYRRRKYKVANLLQYLQMFPELNANN